MKIPRYLKVKSKNIALRIGMIPVAIATAVIMIIFIFIVACIISPIAAIFGTIDD